MSAGGSSQTACESSSIADCPFSHKLMTLWGMWHGRCKFKNNVDVAASRRRDAGIMDIEELVEFGREHEVCHR